MYHFVSLMGGKPLMEKYLKLQLGYYLKNVSRS